MAKDKRYYSEAKESGFSKGSDSHPMKGRGYIYKEENGRVAQGEYAGYNARRTEEMQDAGMIREDRNEIANLPQNVMIKAYPKTGPYLPEGLDDTIRGVDYQMDEDDGGRMKVEAPHKY